MPARCSSCQAEIFWTRTQSGARIPMNYDPDPAGRFVVEGDGARVRMLRLDETTTARRWTSHFATCPHAARHRKRSPLAPDFGRSPLADRDAVSFSRATKSDGRTPPRKVPG